MVKKFIIFIILTITITLIYSNTFNAPFVFDDLSNIVNKPSIHLTTMNLDNLKNAVFMGLNENRWIPNLTLSLNYYFGRLDTFGYHLANVAIHILTAWVLFHLLLLISNAPSLKLKQGYPVTEVAFIATLLWAIHPLQTNAVTYIVQRMTSLAALFFLLSIFCYAKARLAENALTKRILYGCLCLICGLASFACKENSLILPFIVIAFDIYFLQHPDKNRKSTKFYINICVATIIFASSTYFILGDNFISTILSGYKTRDFTLTERILTESRIIFHYLSLVIYPHPGRLNINYDYPLSTSLINPPQTLTSVIGIILLLLMVTIFFKHHKILSFLIFWFLANLLIESSIVPLELIYEHRMYLPSMMLFFGGVYYTYHLNERLPYLVKGSFAVLAIVSCIFTWQRNTVWTDEVILWKDVVSKSPGLTRGYENLCQAYIDQEKYQEAFKVYDQAVIDGHESLILLTNGGASAYKLGKFNLAVKILERALELDFSQGESHYNLGLAYAKLGQIKKARRHMMLGMQLEKARRY